jgi:mannose-1-phosphate guanylyltransferase
MLQRVWSQLQAAGFGESIYVATGRAQAEIIQGQLNGNVQLIVEPERRDTFPAIALACSYLHSVARIDADETVCVLPVDSFTENRFYAGLKEL